MKDACYFCLELTENEHFCVEDEISQICKTYGWELVYYRRLKDGHVPMYREVKITGDNIRHINSLIQEKYSDFMKPNPYKETEE